MIRLRAATRHDCDDILRWNNEASVRKVSLNTQPITADEHRHWFSAKLVDPRCWLFIIEYDGTPAGIVRLDDRPDDDFATISIALAPDMRGLGIGPHAVRVACKLHARRRPSCRIIAWILDDNTGSQRCFERAGFVLLTTCLYDERRWQIFARRAATEMTVEKGSLR